MSNDETSVEIEATPKEIESLSEKIISFGGTLDGRNQVMMSALLSLAEDQRTRRRLETTEPDDDDVQGFGMTVNASRGALFESTDGYVNSASRPIVVCASGTAQVNRAWSLMERLGESGCLLPFPPAFLSSLPLSPLLFFLFPSPFFPPSLPSLFSLFLLPPLPPPPPPSPFPPSPQPL